MGFVRAATANSDTVAAHEQKADPHPQYLLQSEGDARYRQSSVAITDAELPSTITRDAEVTAQITAHEAKADPHPNLWQRIVAGFLSLAGGRILKNNPAIANTSFFGGTNHLELATDNGSNPILSFHKGGVSATSLYHAGYGNDSLRIRNADGLDAAIAHDGNIGTKTAGNANNLLNLLSGWAATAAHWNGTYRWRHLGGWVAGDDAILVHRASVADRAATAASADNVAPSIDAHVATLHGVRVATLNSTLPAIASNSISVALPAGIAPDKIVGINAIAKLTSGGNFAYIRPDGGLMVTGWKYTVHGSNSAITLTVGTAAESQLVFGLPIKILVQYLP